MNRSDKIGKLSRAVREWRGVLNPKNGKWYRQPKIKAQKRVERWVEEIGMNASEVMPKLAAFTSYADFYSWIRGL